MTATSQLIPWPVAYPNRLTLADLHTLRELALTGPYPCSRFAQALEDAMDFEILHRSRTASSPVPIEPMPSEFEVSRQWDCNTLRRSIAHYCWLLEELEDRYAAWPASERFDAVSGYITKWREPLLTLWLDRHRKRRPR